MCFFVFVKRMIGIIRVGGKWNDKGKGGWEGRGIKKRRSTAKDKRLRGWKQQKKRETAMRPNAGRH